MTTPSTTRFRRGDVVLVPFPFTDLTDVRQRPGVVVSADWFNDSRPDLVLAAVTSRIPASLGSDELLISGPDLAEAGLPSDSIIRAGKLFTIDRSLVRRTLGSAPDSLISLLNEKIRAVFEL